MLHKELYIAMGEYYPALKHSTIIMVVRLLILRKRGIIGMKCRNVQAHSA